MDRGSHEIELNDPVSGSKLDDLIERLVNDMNLSSLSLIEMRIDDGAFQKLVRGFAENNHRISNLKVPHTGIKLLAQLNFLLLKCLDLSGNVFYSAAVDLAEALAKNKRLQKLKLSGVQLNGEGISENLGNALAQNDCLLKINLSACWLGNEGLASLSQGLEKNNTLTSIDLSNNLINDFTHFVKCIGANSAITTLNLSANQINADMAALIGDELRQNKSLKQLSISNCQLDNEGAGLIFEALANHPSLEAFYINDNLLGPGAIIGLNSMLKGKTVLNYINFGGNRIGVRGLTTLQNGLQQNKTLRTFILSDNDLSDEACVVLAKSLALNESLEKLTLSGNCITDTGIALLKDALEKSKTLKRIKTKDNVTSVPDIIRSSQNVLKAVPPVAENNAAQDSSIAHPLQARVFILGNDGKTYAQVDVNYCNVLVYKEAGEFNMKISKQDKSVVAELRNISKIVFQKALQKDNRSYVYWTYFGTTYTVRFGSEADTEKFFSNVKNPKPLVKPVWVNASNKNKPVTKKSFKRLNTAFVKFNEIPFTPMLMGVKIDSGAQGMVRKGLWQGNVVAVKQLLVNAEWDLVNFKRELDILSTLKHENIVAVIGACTLGVEKLLIMEYADAGSLYEFLHVKHPSGSGLKEFKWLMLDIARGVHYLHTRGIMHRDLKPANVLLKMLKDRIQLKIADFGSAKRQQPLNPMHTASGNGTLNYMAPERFDDKAYTQYTEAVDVYSMGMIMYEILERKIPFQEHYDILTEVLKGTRPQFTDRTPLFLRTLITSCWHANPYKRPSSLEVLRAIENL